MKGQFLNLETKEARSLENTVYLFMGLVIFTKILNLETKHSHNDVPNSSRPISQISVLYRYVPVQFLLSNYLVK